MGVIHPSIWTQFTLLAFMFNFHGAFCQTEPDNTAIIVGCTIGGFVFLLLILLATYYFCKPSSRRQGKPKENTSYSNPSYAPQVSKAPSLIGNGHSSSFYDGRRNSRDFVHPVPVPLPLQKPVQKAPSKAYDYQPRLWMTGSQMLGDGLEPYAAPRRMEKWDITASDPNLYKVDVVDRHVMNQKERSAVFSAKSSSGVQRSQSFGDPRKRPAPVQPKPMPPIPAASEADSDTQPYSPSRIRPISTESFGERDRRMSSLRVASELALSADPKQIGVQHFAVTRPDGGHDLYAIPLRSQISVDGGESEGEESVGQRTLSGSQYGAHGKEITSSAFEFLEDYDASMISENELKARSFRSHVSN